ncbi:MAG: 50S ribosomal subunit-associated GTPase HflX [Pseudohongiellaceae bacterium]|jgi:50S ribosomal subunit-associated GTPase HflX
MAIEIQKQAQGVLGDVAFLIALNKADLQDKWMLTEADVDDLKTLGAVVFTSAKNGDNVESLFSQLALDML